MSKCCVCENPSFDDSAKSPLCRECRNVLAEFRADETFGEFSDEDRRLGIDRIFATFDRELTRRDPDLGRKVRLALAGGDAAIEGLATSLSDYEKGYALATLLVVIAHTTGLPGVPA